MSVSVVVPVYNGAEVLAQTVPSLLALKGVDEWVWVDDGSTDGSADLLAALVGGVPHARLLRQPRNAGRSAARNCGIDAADGDVLVFFDCDVRPPPDAAAQMTARLGRGTVASVAGVRPVLGVRRDPYASYLRLYPRGAVGAEAGDAVPWRYFLTAACSVERSAVEAAGGFDESVAYGEDFALACRLARRWPTGLGWSGVTVDMFGVGDLDLALQNVRQFGQALPRIAAGCPEALRVAGIEGAARSRVMRQLAAVPVPTSVLPALRALPPAAQARAVRYLLGHALLAAYHGA